MVDPSNRTNNINTIRVNLQVNIVEVSVITELCHFTLDNREIPLINHTMNIGQEDQTAMLLIKYITY